MMVVKTFILFYLLLNEIVKNYNCIPLGDATFQMKPHVYRKIPHLLNVFVLYRLA